MKLTVKAATLVEEDEDDDDKTSLVIVNGRAISVRFGHNRDSASANSLLIVSWEDLVTLLEDALDFGSSLGTSLEEHDFA